MPQRLRQGVRLAMKGPAGKFPGRKVRKGAAAGEAAAVRFAIPDSGVTAFDDAVFGKVEFANSRVGRFCPAALRRRPYVPPERGDR